MNVDDKGATDVSCEWLYRNVLNAFDFIGDIDRKKEVNCFWIILDKNLICES